MRAIFGPHVIMACVLGVGACTTDNPSMDNNPADDNPAIDESAPIDSAAIHTPGLVAIPDELSFDNLSGAADEDNETGISACHVTLVYCRDPDFGKVPSFCYNGCSYAHAVQVAKKLCRSTCGHIDCSHPLLTADC